MKIMGWMGEPASSLYFEQDGYVCGQDLNKNGISLFVGCLSLGVPSACGELLEHSNLPAVH
jgi:hypothetical protein